MDWIDYRKKLGLSFEDRDKANLFITKALNILDTAFHRSVHDIILDQDYINFCNLTGTAIEHFANYGCYDKRKSEYCINVIRKHTINILDFLSYYIAFANCNNLINNDFTVSDVRYYLIYSACIALNEAQINYEIFKEGDEYYIFPKGVPELDDALVSQPLNWLSEYPSAEKLWSQSLKKYAEVTDDNARDVADGFRITLETFFQNFFKSDRSLENLKSEYGNYLKKHNVPTEICNNFQTLLQQYASFMNSHVKHHNDTNRSILEYIMYQTGNIIRLLITLSRTKEVEE